MNKITKGLLTAYLLIAAVNASAHSAPDVPDAMDLDTLVSAFGWDFDSAVITTEKVADNLYVLFGVGGNIAVSVGEDGVFIVDDQFPQMMPKIRDAIGDVGGGGIDFAVTTHWHFDHAEGNLELGPAGTWLVAHENSREMMKQDHVINLVQVAYLQKAYPESAWPDITFDDSMRFYLNGEAIELMHFGPAHTTGDTAVFFRSSNVVHMGDVFNNSGYPFIDAGNGGELNGLIHFCRQTLANIDEQTVVIPGHGPVSDHQGLAEYVVMLETVRDRLLSLIADGATLEEVYAAKPTAEFDASFGDNTGFINRAYTSLTHRPVAVDRQGQR
ncbi:MAG: MBL fold metallo-hydrolase [Proteobacteria bacterium]|nr:MBL fold metallo-hydrolase [Pseudomonadota bacterium]